MEIQQILIFAFLGCIALVVMAGGAAAMMDADPEPATLAASGAVGAGLGAGAAWALNAAGGGASVSDVTHLMDTMMKGGGAFGTQEMRVGLPAF